MYKRQAKGDVKSTTLYVFDENNDFYKQITVDNDYLLQVKPVEINCPGDVYKRQSPYTPVANDNVALGVKTCSSGMSSFEEQATAAPRCV